MLRNSCNYCRSGSYNLCPDTVFAATPPHDGTLSKYYITQSDFCYPIPPHMDLEEGALVEPVAVAAQITKVGNVRPNQTVVVFGCGPIGLLCQSVCKAYAAKKVIGVDISPSRLEFAKSFGVDGVFLPPAKPETVTDDCEWSEKLAGLIKEEFGLGDGPDVVLEATGAQSCIQTGIQLCRKGGIYVQAGMGKEVSSFAFLRHQGKEINDSAERCVPNHCSVYPRFDHPRLDPVYHGLLSHGRGLDSQWKNRCEEIGEQQVHIRTSRRCFRAGATGTGECNQGHDCRI